MACAVAEAFNGDKVVLVEAGTGTGKSLAYLVPSILWAVRNNQRVVISTNTINLQEQLIKKDVPFLLSTIDQWGLDPATRRVPVEAVVIERVRVVK